MQNYIIQRQDPGLELFEDEHDQVPIMNEEQLIMKLFIEADDDAR